MFRFVLKCLLFLLTALDSVIEARHAKEARLSQSAYDATEDLHDLHQSLDQAHADLLKKQTDEREAFFKNRADKLRRQESVIDTFVEKRRDIVAERVAAQAIRAGLAALVEAK